MTRSLLPLTLVLTLATFGCGGGEAPDKGKGSDGDKGKAGHTAHAPHDAKGADDDKPAEPKLDVVKSEFGKLADDTAIDHYLLTNSKGLSVGVITYGAIVTAVNVPDKDGKAANVTLHWDDMAGWEKNPSYFGCIAGRYANRIAEGKFTLDDTEYEVTKNEPKGGGQMLHGGDKGFDKRVWTAETIKGDDTVGVELTYVSADGEEGFPGELTTKVVYSLNEENELRIEYEATTDKPTVVNLTNHCYWNLAGAGSGNVLEQTLQLDCDQFVAIDPEAGTLIPTGEFVNVADQPPFDFTKGKKIGAGIANLGDGFDHCFVVKGENGTLRHVATLTDEASGRTMTVESTEPGVQVYTGNHFDGSDDNKGYVKHAGVCLETNHYPDSPNQPEFPSTVLRPGETYTHNTIHRFGIVTAE